MESPVSLPPFEDHNQQTHKYTTCYMCACRCGVKVTLENNKIRYIQGNPNHPVNRGVLCGKGNAAIMKQYSPAKLKHPMRRVPGSERGEGKFEPVSWDDALSTLTERLQKIRTTNPNKLAFFTGRDQMQALTGFWASQFGTLNWAAHGGFCSVNMAAAGLLTTGYSFWEFGEPDWDNTRLFLLWGVAEDHASNPIKIGLKKLKERGAKIIAINPVRTGYQAIADEWLPINPGTDGMLILSLIHELLSQRNIDETFLVRYTNLPYLLNADGFFARDSEGNAQVWCQQKNAICSVTEKNTAPALVGQFTAQDGTTLTTAMSLALDQYLDDQYAPENAAKVCGISAQRITKLAQELHKAAFENPFSIAGKWTDTHGNTHNDFQARPVSMHAMRGISAHSNGFQSCRALHFLQALLGAIDAPGSHLAKPPYPKHPPAVLQPAKQSAAQTPLSGAPLGIPQSPKDLVIDDKGNPLRIDKAYSWDAPLSAHGMMHMVIANAAQKDPYAIDTLLIFMANLAWNSSMNTKGTINHLTSKDDRGNYNIPFIVTVDAFHSEMVNYSDLILPDTTYLERYDTISLLDRPISEPHSVCDAIRQPVVEREHDTRPWQEVMIDLANRLEFPAFFDADNNVKFPDYKTFITQYEKAPGIGFLAGWRGKQGEKHLRGEPNENQWNEYIKNECFFKQELEPSMRYFRFANRDYLKHAHAAGWTSSDKAIVIELYSEILRKFQFAGEGKGDICPPHEYQKERLKQYCQPLPFFYHPIEHQQTNAEDFPLYAVTQRPMFMYHSWDSQNAWLRQIASYNYIYVNTNYANKHNIRDEGWVWLQSATGKIAAMAKLMHGVAENTVWTWNAIGKDSKTWGLDDSANESVEGFIMNHLISEWLPKDKQNVTHSNSDPVTGQAAWYDLRISMTAMTKAEEQQHIISISKKAPCSVQPLRYASHPAVNLSRSITNTLFK